MKAVQAGKTHEASDAIRHFLFKTWFSISKCQLISCYVNYLVTLEIYLARTGTVFPNSLPHGNDAQQLQNQL